MPRVSDVYTGGWTKVWSYLSGWDSSPLAGMANSAVDQEYRNPSSGSFPYWERKFSKIIVIKLLYLFQLFCTVNRCLMWNSRYCELPWNFCGTMGKGTVELSTEKFHLCLHLSIWFSWNNAGGISCTRTPKAMMFSLEKTLVGICFSVLSVRKIGNQNSLGLWNWELMCFYF